MKKTLLLCALLGALGAADTLAQETNACGDPQARAYLDVGNVLAEIGLGGIPIWPGSVAYEVPKNSGVLGLTCLMTWFGGIVEDEVRVTSNRELWAGPLDDDGNPPTDCTPYDRLFEMTRQDLDRFNRHGDITPNLRDWPWHLGAPVIDGDGIADNYNLDGGDRPELLGDQMFWWIMNDAGDHWHSGSKPIGMEIQATVFGYNKPSGPIGSSTFFRYKFVYKGTAPLEDAYFSLYPEPELGYNGDNYQGSDPALHLAYIYNADNIDGDPDRPADETYGANPPALGFTFLPPPIDAAFTGLSSFMAYPHRQTNEPAGFYNLMRGLWSDGRPVTYGGDGRDFSDIPTPFFYPGDPLTGEFWSQMNLDGQGTAGGWAYDSVISTGPFSMQPGDEHEIAFAVVWVRGKDHLDSVRQLKNEVARMQQNAEAFLSPDYRYALSEVPPPTPPDPLGFAQNYPNPFSEATTIRYSLPQSMYVRLAVYDVLGREIAVLIDEQQEGGIYAVDFEARSLPPGVYVARFEVDSFRFTKTMVVVR